jgi:hypothetical protein
MNRRTFFGRITKAFAGAALVAHLELGSLVPIPSVATVDERMAELDRYLTEMWDEIRFGPLQPIAQRDVRPRTFEYPIDGYHPYKAKP